MSRRAVQSKGKSRGSEKRDGRASILAAQRPARAKNGASKASFR